MPNPRWLRYDPNDDKSRHAAADADCCEEMAEKYRWRLVSVELNGSEILPVDCVFDGKTELPDWYKEREGKEDEDD